MTHTQEVTEEALAVISCLHPPKVTFPPLNFKLKEEKGGLREGERRKFSHCQAVHHS